MKRILSIVLVVTLLVTLSMGAVFADPATGKGSGMNKGKGFSDTKGHWGHNYIMKLQGLGLLNGYEDGTFKPDKKLSHAELAVVLANLQEKKMGIRPEELDEDDIKNLKSIPGWARKAVKQGIKGNYLNMKRFHSQVQVDRLTACVELAKLLRLKPVSPSEFSTLNPFKDRGLMKDEDFGYLLALYKEGLIKGYPDGNFNPNRLLSRADFATIIAKLYDQDNGDKDVKDTQKPTWTSNSAITAAAISATTVELRWMGAVDNEKVIGYNIRYVDNEIERNRQTVINTVKIENLNPNTVYTFTVEAKDAAGNWSDDGPSIIAKTMELEDTIEPIWPNNAALSVIQDNYDFTVTWPDAVDENMDYYRVHLIQVVDGDNNLLIADERIAVGENQFEVEDLEEDTQYIFKIRAYDTSGNWSRQLNVTFTTD